MGAGQLKHQGLVRDMGGDDAHVHPRLGRVAQGGVHAVTDDQIGGHGIDIVLCLADQVQVYRLPHRLVVQGVVGIGLDIVSGPPGGLRRQGRRAEAAVVLLHIPDILPHGEEHHRHAPRRLPLQQDGAVLPVAEAGLLVDILVGQVDAAGEGGVAVDDAELPVIPVVHADGDDGLEAVEKAAGDAGLGLKLVGVVHGEGVQGAHVVVDHPHVHPGGVLFPQDLHNGVPEHAGGDDEIFQEDILLRLFQLLQHDGEGVIPQRKIARPGVGVHGAAGVPLQIAGLIGRIRPQPLQLLRLVVLLQLLQHGAIHTLHLPPLPG